MSPETIELIIKWGPLAIVGVTFIICFLVGVIRGTYKVVRRLVYVVLYVVLIWLFIDKITGFILDFNIPINDFGNVRSYIVNFIEDNESINKFLSYSPELKSLVIDNPEIMVSPLLFIVLVLVGLPLSFPIYWVYLFIWWIFAKFVFKREKYEKDNKGEILRNEKGKKIKVVRKKHRLVGGLIRGVQGVVLICISLIPVNFVNRIYNKAKANADLEEGETLCGSFSVVDIDEQICTYLDVYNETIFAKMSGEKSLDKFVFDGLTSAEVDGQKVKLEQELSSVAVSVVLLNESGLLDLLTGEINLDTLDLSVIKFDKLNLMIDSLFSSYAISKLSEAGVKYVLNEVLNDNLVELLKDDDIVSKLEYEDSAQIKDELKNIVNVIKYAVENNMDDLIINNKDDVVSIVKGINEGNLETLLNKILSLRIISNAMPSAIKAYGEKYGVNVPSEMTSELNSEITNTFVNAVKFVKTMELTKVEDITEGNIVDNLANALFEEGALKDNSKESLATLLNDINSSYLFKDVISSQANDLLKDKDYKIDARVIKYVDSKEAWLKELEVLEDAYILYDEYSENDIVNYNRVTGLLNNLSGTKVLISVLPFAYDELLPKVGIEIDSEGLPVIDFDGSNEDASKKEFYDTWEAELTVLKNIGDSLEVLELQSLEDINVDMLDNSENVEALSAVMGEVYKSNLLKEPFVEFMVDTMNEFVVDYEVEFTKEELLSVDTEEKWSNELSNIKKVLDIDFSDENNINSTNLSTIFNAVGDMQLFNNKKIDILKYAVRESNFLTTEEYDSISWPTSTDQESINAFWNNETSVLVDIVDKKDAIEALSADTDLDDLDTDEIGGILNRTKQSSILNPIVTNKISELFVDNGVKDDRDEGESTTNLKNSISHVSDWKVELAIVKKMTSSIDGISTTTYAEIVELKRYSRSGEEGNYTYTQVNNGDYLKVNDEYYLIENAYRYSRSGEEGSYTYTQANDGAYLKITETKVDDIFASIEESELLKNSRANLLLEAVKTINITEIPSNVTVDTLSYNNYTQYNHEKNVIVKVSKDKNMFDNLGKMELKDIDTDKIGELMDTVASSAIFKDYFVGEIVKVFKNENNELYDDRDYGTGKTDNLENSVASVSSWKNELKIIQDMLNMTQNNFDEVPTGDTRTRVEIMFDNIEESELLKYKRANLLIKVIKTINLTGVSVPNDVTVETLSDNNYSQYNKEADVFKAFAASSDVIDNLDDNISSLNNNQAGKTAVANVLNAMKVSAIFQGKYVTTVTSVLNTIDSEVQGSGYATISVNRSDAANNYANINWVNEINALSTISANIETVSTYDETSIDTEEERTETVGIIGSTLDAVSSSAFLGESAADTIADSVISALTDGYVTNVTKDANKTWSKVFEDALDSIPSL